MSHENHVGALIDYLVDAHVLDRANPWVEALQAVPRHRFVPDVAWAEPMDDRPEHLINRQVDPAAWWDAIYSNTAIITQRGNGTAELTDRSSAPTSSLSCPHVAVEFLQLLDLAPHHRVLEIGTGTGWTAAMLTHRVGDHRVTTIEVDRAVAAVAVANLKEAEAAPAALVGDGSAGHPDHAPYDRVHVTCGVRDIPYAWVEQTRPGGVIVLPWMPPGQPFGMRLRLDVLDDGTAIGRPTGGASFMMLRSQRLPTTWPGYPDGGALSETHFHPHTAHAARWTGFGPYLAAAAPHLLVTTAGWEQGDDEAWRWVTRLRSTDSAAWGIAEVAESGGMTVVRQGGAHTLWDDYERAYMNWLKAGSPAPERLGFTVTPAGQHMWLDSPDQVVEPVRRWRR
ncbi:methyltransferase domain-containing protein [Nonomuraea sp. NPDC059023]|uniref:methyltransferase domain-containing protein n=1 Tax=unclassified Nonomuraea TaxID=2593643 RepID=UPI0036C9E11B